MNAELWRITFSPGIDPRAIIEGDGLPFRHAKAELRHLPGDVILVTLRRDQVEEQRQAAKGPESFLSFLYRLCGLS